MNQQFNESISIYTKRKAKVVPTFKEVQFNHKLVECSGENMQTTIYKHDIYTQVKTRIIIEEDNRIKKGL